MAKKTEKMPPFQLQQNSSRGGVSSEWAREESLPLLPFPGCRLLLHTGHWWERRIKGLHLDGLNGWIFCGSGHLIPKATRSLAFGQTDLVIWECGCQTLYFLWNNREVTGYPYFHGACPPDKNLNGHWRARELNLLCDFNLWVSPIQFWFLNPCFA